jgi:hypothetical protein
MEDKLACVYPMMVWCRPVMISYVTRLINLPLQTVMTKTHRVSHVVRIESNLLHVCARVRVVLTFQQTFNKSTRTTQVQTVMVRVSTRTSTRTTPVQTWGTLEAA